MWSVYCAIIIQDKHKHDDNTNGRLCDFILMDTYRLNFCNIHKERKVPNYVKAQ